VSLLVAMSDTNGGMFMTLTTVIGDKEDAGTYVPEHCNRLVPHHGDPGRRWPGGLANIPWLTIVSVIAPIAADAVFGNLDRDLRNFFGSHEPIIVPFMGFTLGQTISLSPMVTAGFPGMALDVFVLVVTGTVCIVVDRLLGGTGSARRLTPRQCPRPSQWPTRAMPRSLRSRPCRLLPRSS